MSQSRHIYYYAVFNAEFMKWSKFATFIDIQGQSQALEFQCSDDLLNNGTWSGKNSQSLSVVIFSPLRADFRFSSKWRGLLLYGIVRGHFHLMLQILRRQIWKSQCRIWHPAEHTDVKRFWNIVQIYHLGMLGSQFSHVWILTHFSKS